MTPNVGIAADENHCSSPGAGHAMGLQIFVAARSIGFIHAREYSTLGVLHQGSLETKEIFGTRISTSTESRVHT